MTDEAWINAINKRPSTLIKSNSKLAKSNIWQWSIPAAVTMLVKNNVLKEVNTCPGAGSCLEGCYAQQGGYLFTAAMIAHARNLQFYVNDKQAWKDTIIADIKAKRNLKAFRIHDSGDFFSIAYLNDWIEIMEALPEVQFYAYTKMIPLFENNKDIPKNFTVIYSYGGKYDDRINTNVHRHSKVFLTNEDMEQNGYSDTTETDENAANPSILKIGLVYHGKPKYSWSAN